jgi:hypothetical protein
MCKVLVTGEMYSTHVLKGAAANFIRRNGTAVMRTAAWRRLMLERPHLVDYVVARLAGVPPPQPGDYEAEKEEDESGREKVKDSSSRKDLPAGVQEEVNGHSKNEEDEDEPPNKKRTMK